MPTRDVLCKNERRLRVGTRNFAGLCSECKQEVGQVIQKLDVVAGHESWERDSFTVSVCAYKWFGIRESKRGEMGWLCSP